MMKGFYGIFASTIGRTLMLGIALVALGSLAPRIAHAAEQARSGSAIEEIIVTAQKREESANDVGMSIQTATGETLAKLGITDTSDLIKVVSGLNVTKTTSQNYIYTIRGVGFYETSLATSPTVSLYTDEMPRQFAPMTTGMLLDVERVEVLKGPQGTLFGLNSTGGAINYIANKPTPEFEAGIDVTAGNFETGDLSGFLSGPINEQWSYRVAGRAYTQGDWQENYLDSTEAGERDLFVYRGALAYEGDRLSALLTVSGFTDEGDTQRPQLYAFKPLNPVNGIPPAISAVPLSPRDNESAAWSPCINSDPLTNVFYTGDCEDPDKDNDLFTVDLRLDINLTDDIVLTSLSSYNDYDREEHIDFDGHPLQNYERISVGALETFFQEIRVAGSLAETGNWVVGVNYERQETDDTYLQSYGFSSVTLAQDVDFLVFLDTNGIVDLFPNLPADYTVDVPPGVPANEPLGPTFSTNFQESDTISVFAAIDYPVTDKLSLQAGVRYTDQERDANVCTRDGGDGGWASISWFIQGALGSSDPVFPTPGTCSTTGIESQNFNPDPNGYDRELNEDNISWRLGANYFIDDDVMVYGNVSKGYKAGQFPTLPGSAIQQYIPAVQEELLAYEIGVKATLANQTVQFNAALFYYDYEDKQVLGAYDDDTFGALPSLVNVPEADVIGGEIDLIWAPVQGLFIHPSISYADSETKGEFRNFDSFTSPANSATKDFSGQDFPTAPELTANIDIQYEWTVTGDWIAFVGINGNYQEETRAFFHDECKEPGTPCTSVDGPEVLFADDELIINERWLVDARLGVESEKWRIWVWGRNILDRHYWNNERAVNDVMVRVTGMPQTYGLTASYRFGN